VQTGEKVLLCSSCLVTVPHNHRLKFRSVGRQWRWAVRALLPDHALSAKTPSGSRAKDATYPQGQSQAAWRIRIGLLFQSTDSLKTRDPASTTEKLLQTVPQQGRQGAILQPFGCFGPKDLSVYFHAFGVYFGAT
jgi:hypothetical protein